MAQHDYVIDNQSAPSLRADLNAALAAIATTNGGGTAPSPTYAGQLWHDTSSNLLRIRNEDNDGWITLAVLDQAADTSAPPDSSITFAKMAGSAVVTSSETISSNNNDTTIPTSAAVKAYADAEVAANKYTDAEARAAQAGHSAGGVGSYAFAVPEPPSADFSFGSTIAGSSLRPTGVIQALPSALSGTWRCMGYSDFIAGSGGDPNRQGATLWLRIS